MSLPDKQIILHRGVFKPVASVSEAIFMITGMTIGAGVLGIPYVVSRVGLKIGLAYIFILGFTILSLNLMVGEIAVRTKEPFQLPGLVGKYLGSWAKQLLTVIIIFSSYGALLAYVVGVGNSCVALFGGSPIVWSVMFWSIGSVIIWQGMRMIKKEYRFISILVIAIIIGVSFFIFPQVSVVNWHYLNYANLFLPFGVILFALHATPAIAEAHALLPGSQKHFRKAVILGTLIPIILYALFAVAVVGVMGLSTTEIATVGLGQKFGNVVLLVGNIVAILAMSTGFFGVGIALKHMFTWDYKFNKRVAEFLVISVPLFLFLSGLRSFVHILGVVGGTFIGVESILIILTCYQARKNGDLSAVRYNLKYFWIFAIPVFIIFTAVTIVSVARMVGR